MSTAAVRLKKCTKAKHAAWVTEMALGYPIFHFSDLASPMIQTFAYTTAIYGMSTKGYAGMAWKLTNQNKC